MAKRKQRFKYHGKCEACAGAITDWRERVAIETSRLYSRELARREIKLYRYCDKCRPLYDAIARLSAPNGPSVETGRMSARQANIQQLNKDFRGKKIRIAHTADSFAYALHHVDPSKQ
jgi:hypothetical protein